MSAEAASGKAVKVQRLVGRVAKWFAKKAEWGHGTLRLTPAVTLTRYHWDDWDGDCLCSVTRSLSIGIEWLWWDWSQKLWARSWKYPATERFLQ